jgi:hypothetical protein
VNAIPSKSRTPRVGYSGRMSLRDVASISEPSVDRAGPASLDLRGGKRVGCSMYLNDGKRHAEKASRGGISARLTAQGRVGQRSRHIAPHLALHRLLSAQLSAHRDADRPLPFPLAWNWTLRVSRGTFCHLILRPEFQPGRCSAPRLEADDTKQLVATGDGNTTSSRGKSRGKGVLAA